MGRAVAAGFSVVVGAVIGVVTALATTHPSLGLWVALAVAVVVGAILQIALSRRDHGPSPHVKASAPGAVAVGGSVHGGIFTRVFSKRVGGSPVSPVEPAKQDGVAASAPGSAAVGGDVGGPISTDVTGTEDSATS
jgi:hypothetical protein